jgi:hypothetical protein
VGNRGGQGSDKWEEEFKRGSGRRVGSIEESGDVFGDEVAAAKTTPEWSAGFDGMEWDRNSGWEMRFWPSSSNEGKYEISRKSKAVHGSNNDRHRD